MDTIEPMVVPGQFDPETAPPKSLARRLWWLFPVAAILLVVPSLLAVSVPYYSVSPGDARRIDDLIKAPKEKTFPPRGRILLATVGLSAGRVSAYEAIRGWLDSNTDVIDEKRILGTTPRKKLQQQSLQDMDESKQKAEVVALRRLGYQVTAEGDGVVVVKVVAPYPAAGHLHEGDVITAIDGTRTALSDDMLAIVAGRKPGDVVRFSVTAPGGATRVEQLKLAARPDGTAIVGTDIITKNFHFALPFDVHIDSADIGGPSAGLAFTLALLDELSPGELTGGHRVAATGTIDLDGTVGPVGGVAQKTVAVNKAKADYFLVPPQEYAEALSRAGPRLHVIKVTTLEDALAALGRIGGDVAALGPPPPQGTKA